MATHPCTIGILEVNNTISATMANSVKILLDSFGLHNQVIAYVKDKGLNLNTQTSILTYVVFYFSLWLACPFVGSCFSHAMSKVAQYATNDTKMCVKFLEVSLKEVQSSLQKTITLTKKSKKGKAQWKESCIVLRLPIKMLKDPVKTWFAFWVILF